MTNSSKLQLTLAILKPDLTLRPFSVEHVRSTLLQNNFIAIKSKQEHLSSAKIKDFYREHEGKFFYNRLVTYMSSGYSHIHILGRSENAIKKWRDLMGPTKVLKTRYEQPDTIRGMFGITDTRNSSHGSDSEETARKEIEFFFPDFNIDAFYQSGQDQEFLNGQISQTLKLDRKLFQHFVTNSATHN